jgi:hypothetical protein
MKGNRHPIMVSLVTPRAGIGCVHVSLSGYPSHTLRVIQFLRTTFQLIRACPTRNMHCLSGVNKTDTSIVSLRVTLVDDPEMEMNQTGCVVKWFFSVSADPRPASAARHETGMQVLNKQILLSVTETP